MKKILIFLLVVALIFGIYLINMQRDTCQKTGKIMVILIQNEKFVPNKIAIKRCDIVKIVNKDKNALYLPAFGDHPKHIEYKGFTEKVIGFNQTNSFVAGTIGTFHLHDHIKDKAEGDLIVN